MEQDTLNKKLAEWAGFQTMTWINYPTRSPRIVKTPDGVVGSMELIDFTESLDACFKWLVPEAIDKIMSEQECGSDLAYDILFKKWLWKLELIIPKAALALCQAIGELIDGS